MSGAAEAGQATWVNRVIDASDLVGEAIINASGEIDPTVSRRPESEVTKPYSPARTHWQANERLMYYRDKVAVRKDDLNDLWYGEFVPNHSLESIGRYHLKRVEEAVMDGGGPQMATPNKVRYRLLLPLEVIVQAKQRLDRCVDELGYLPKKKKRPLYEIKWDPEEYDEPVKESIQRPM